MYPDQGPDLGLDGGRRTWFIAAGATVVIGLLVIAILVVTSSSESSSPDTTPDPTAVDQAYGKPDDGLDSIGIPLTVSPLTELVDGQTVTVEASGFPAGGSVGVIQCTNASKTAGQQACDFATLNSGVPVGSDGTMSLRYTVKQVLDIGGQSIDCGTGNVDPAGWVSGQETNADQFTCIIGVGYLGNYDVSGNAAISYVGAVFGGGAPELPATTTTTAPVLPDIPCPEGSEVMPVIGLSGETMGYQCADPVPPTDKTDTTSWGGGDHERRGTVPTTQPG